MNDKELYQAVLAEEAAGRVNRSTDEALVLFKYSDDMIIRKDEWNAINMQCRGLVFDISDPDDPQRLTWPLPKFFNIGEYKGQIPDLPFSVYEKLDGSNITLFIDPETGRWRACTPGSLTSEQALYANKLLNQEKLEAIFGDTIASNTPVFELITPWNQIVCNYGDRDELVLLTAFNSESGEWTESALDDAAEFLGCSRPRKFTEAALGGLETLTDAEGYVIRYENGLRLKAKGPWYIRIHRLLGCVSPKRVLAILRGLDEHGETPETVRAAIPPHVPSQFDDISSQLIAHHERLLITARKTLEEVQKKQYPLRKWQAIYIQENCPKEAWSLVFHLLDGKDIENAAWKIVEKNYCG